MPRFCLETNVPLESIPENFLTLCTKTLAESMNKPESFIIAYILPGQDMCFGNSDEPSGIANISSVGGLGIEENKKLAEVFSKLVEEHVGIPKKRLWLTFTENLPEYVAFKGKSFYHMVICRASGEPVFPDPDE